MHSGKEEAMPAVNVMIKPASGLCNLRCEYCFYANEMAHRSQASFGIMSDETTEAVVRETLGFAEKSCTFAFQGGEPTLVGLDYYRRFLEFENKYNQNHVKIHHALQTNGYLLDEEWCRFLAEHHFLVGLSLDGIRPTHDAYRRHANGDETYFHTLDKAKLLQEHGVDFNILTVVHARTAPRIRRIYESYRRQGFQWQQYIACLDPIGAAPGSMNYSLTPEMYGQFMIDLFDCWKEDVYRGTTPAIRQFENYIGILRGILPESCEQRGICSVQHVVEADGSVYPCDFYVLDEYRMGNLKEESFLAIHERIRSSFFLQNADNHTVQCRKCRWFSLCRGGCRRHREQQGTDFGLNYFCKAYQMFFEARIRELEQIAASPVL